MRFLLVLLLAAWVGCADDDFGRDLGPLDMTATDDGGAEDLATGN